MRISFIFRNFARNLVIMRKSVIILLAMLAMTGNRLQATGDGLQEDLLMQILNGEFKAKTVSEAVMDSLLATGGETDRLIGYERGVWGSEVKTRKVSPDGKYEAYIKDQNLYIYKRLFKTDLAVTRDTNEYIFNGTADWLYNEEFGCSPMFEWSPDSKFLAFVRLDDSEVASYEWQTILGVEEEGSRGGGYPQSNKLLYPRVGTANPKASLCIYDVQYKDIRTIELGEYEYLPRICWGQQAIGDRQQATGGEGKLYVETLNRDQNKMQVYEVNPKSGVSKLWYHEECEDGWIEYSNFDEWQWLNNGNVIVVSDRSGWRQVYLYAANGKKICQLTQDGHDVTRCYGYDEKNKILYYQIANTPMTRQCVALPGNVESGKCARRASVECVPLDDGKGWCEMRMSKDYSRYILDYQTEQMPNRYTMYEVKRGSSAQRANEELNRTNALNEELLARWANDESKGMWKEFFSFVTERGDTIYGWLIKATGNRQQVTGCPMVMMQYSGPGSQRVVQKWNKKFEYALAAEGYIVVCIDPRGTGARGQKWLHETYMNLGVKEAEDIVECGRWMVEREEAERLIGGKVDASRMAIGGWSYGGFETLMTMCQEDSPFKCGFAIAPVTDYRLYDSGYTERFMRRLQVNERGYNNCALPQMAEKLQGRLLIVHGLADDNVHCQNTWEMVDALVQAGKQFDMQVYPDDNHYLKKRGNYEHLHRKLIEFLNEELKE